MADELTPQEKQEAINLLREEKKDLATSIGLMKERNKAMEGVIDVEKDIKKDRRTLSTDIGNQVTSVQESMMGGVEGFVSETFGPLGGFVNLFTMGFVRRRMENAKLETENVKATKKQNERLLGVLASRALAAEGITKEENANFEELKEAKRIASEVNFPSNVKFGIMVETPAAVQLINELCEVGIDFVSLGTNDLTQYTLALDRNNGEVQDLYDEMNPAVLNSIAYVLRRCKKYGFQLISKI